MDSRFSYTGYTAFLSLLELYWSFNPSVINSCNKFLPFEIPRITFIPIRLWLIQKPISKTWDFSLITTFIPSFVLSFLLVSFSLVFLKMLSFFTILLPCYHFHFPGFHFPLREPPFCLISYSIQWGRGGRKNASLLFKKRKYKIRRWLPLRNDPQITGNQKHILHSGTMLKSLWVANKNIQNTDDLSSVQSLIMSNPLQPRGRQHARLTDDLGSTKNDEVEVKIFQETLPDHILSFITNYKSSLLYFWHSGKR